MADSIACGVSTILARLEPPPMRQQRHLCECGKPLRSYDPGPCEDCQVRTWRALCRRLRQRPSLPWEATV